MKTRPTLQQIIPEMANELLAKNAVLVDVREAYERAVERIPGSIELPLSVLAAGGPANLPENCVPIFLCTSGARTNRNSEALAAIARLPAYCLTGGILAWKRAGYPTVRG